MQHAIRARRGLTRRRACLLGTLPLVFSACGEDERLPTGLVLISLDTCRADRVSTYGAQRVNSPNLDAFARESVVWEDCLAQSTSTDTSHWSVFTGQYVHRHRMTTPGEIVSGHTMASVLRERGWRTAAFTGGGKLRPINGFHHGFERFEPTRGTGGFDEVLPRAQRWLLKHSGEPFFLFVHGYDAHCPYAPPEPYRSAYAGWYTGRLHIDGLCGSRGFGPLIEFGRFGADEERYLGDLYDAGVASADSLLGSFFSFLRASGVLENAIVVFLSDHGESLGEHGWVGHTRMWEEQIRVPLVVRFPGGAYAGRRAEPVQLVDVLPTVLEALDVPPPPGVQGVSLLPALRGDAELPRERMRLCQFGVREAVRFDRRWKLVSTREAGHPVELSLYDLVQDPHEERDLAATTDGARRAANMLERYREWRAQTLAEDRSCRPQRADLELPPALADELEQLGYVGDEGDSH